jgi:hypothetical protein
MKILIIDEISFIDARRLFYIHHRLCEIFQVDSSVPFGGVCVVAMGDAYQLPPVLASSMFRSMVDGERAVQGSLRRGQQVHGGSANDRGLDLWKRFCMVRFQQQMRSVDEEHTTFLNHMREHSDQPINEEQRQYLQRLTLTSNDLANDPELVNASIVVMNNKLRYLLNLQRAIRFARARGQPVIRWRVRLGSRANRALSAEAENIIYEMSDGVLYAIFVQGAPSYMNNNENAARGLDNGTFCIFQRLIFADPELQEHVQQLIASARPGDVIDLVDMDGNHCRPQSVLVTVPSVTQADWRASVDANMPADLLDLQENEDPNAPMLVPLGEGKQTKQLSIGQGSERLTVYYYAAPCEIGFAITFHKGKLMIQAFTLQFVFGLTFFQNLKTVV